jgi:hypothetical protein
MLFSVNSYKRGVIVQMIGQLDTKNAYQLAMHSVGVQYTKDNSKWHLMMWEEAQRQMKVILPGQSILVAWEDPAIENEYVLIVKSTNNGYFLNAAHHSK